MINDYDERLIFEATRDAIIDAEMRFFQDFIQKARESGAFSEEEVRKIEKDFRVYLNVSMRISEETREAFVFSKVKKELPDNEWVKLIVSLREEGVFEKLDQESLAEFLKEVLKRVEKKERGEDIF